MVVVRDLGMQVGEARGMEGEAEPAVRLLLDQAGTQGWVAKPGWVAAAKVYLLQRCGAV